MTERWICARCFTSADASATVCPNCGLERGAEAESAAGEVDAPQARPDDAHVETPKAVPVEAAPASSGDRGRGPGDGQRRPMGVPPVLLLQRGDGLRLR